jgi:glycosyltransferase involved in cell wall biosynthesis
MGHLQMGLPRLLAVNSQAAIRNLKDMGVPERRLYFLPNIVDTARFCPRSHRERRTLRILGVGRMGPEKRLDRFLHIVAALAGTGVTAELIGEGTERGALEAQARELGLEPPRLCFRGSLTDLAPVYQEADLLLHTSDWEGTPNVILEAMASGLPVVATRVGGIPDVVQDGVSGFLSAPDEVEGLTRSVRRLLGSSGLRQKMGEAGRAIVQKEYAEAVLGDLLDGLYRKALGMPGPRRGEDRERRGSELARGRARGSQPPAPQFHA